MNNVPFHFDWSKVNHCTEPGHTIVTQKQFYDVHIKRTVHVWGQPSIRYQSDYDGVTGVKPILDKHSGQSETDYIIDLAQELLRDVPRAKFKYNMTRNYHD